MRWLGLIVTGVVAFAQVSSAVADMKRAITGSWVGTLEYRDYKEPASSTKRVKLPTWLTVEAAGADLRFRYTYDDGPGKTVVEVDLVRIADDGSKYKILGKDASVKDSYAITGVNSLRDGKGVLTLSGHGSENDVPVNARTTLRVGRNLLEIIRETGAEGQPFAFRHAYTLVRATAP